MKKIKFSLYFIFISFLTLSTVFILLVQKSYFNFTKPQELVENEILLKDFNPNLDASIISTIESRDNNTDESFDFSILKSSNKETEASITPALTPTLTATPSASPIE